MKYNFSLFAIILLLFFDAPAQEQPTLLQQESKYIYLFKITENQAFQLYQKPKESLVSAYFEKLIDSFPSAENYQKELPPGHYIKTNAQKNIQQTYYQSVKDFNVFVFNNAQDLIIQVYGQDGKIIEKAEVSIGNKMLSFHQKQKAYVDKKSNEKGILKVKYQDVTAFYHLSRAQNSSFLNRSTKNLAYNYPTKYVWLPIEYMAMLPVDGVRSIQNHNATGRVRNTKSFFVNLYKKVACWFDDYSCYDYNVSNYEVAYFVFNKPKFKPEDTLKGKAFIWDEKGKPIEQKLKVNLKKSYRESVQIGEILPTRKGSYDLQLHLHDSLNLDLDKSYSVELIDAENNRVATNRFLFEEYELKGINLSLDVNSTKQYKNEELKVSINAKDENDLRVLDAKVAIELLSLNAEFGSEKQLFLPDTLWSYQIDLKTSKATKFKIPDTIFPKANIEYKLLAKLTTSDQEYVEASEQIKYYFESEKIEYQVKSDSILVEFLQNGKKIASDIRIESIDHFGNANEIFKETTPFQFQIDALHKSYRFITADLEKVVDLNSISTGINARLYRTKDSVFIKVNNPNQLDFSYHIFKKNKEIKSGFGKSLDFSEAENKLTNYYLTLNYVWGGRILERNFVMPINDKNLYVKVNQPKLIYPGQHVDVEVEVVDHKENPVENADILAYGMTSKFNFRPRHIKNFSTQPKNRKLRNSFKASDISDKVFEEELDIHRWKNLAQLDTLNYYQLIYPAQEIYKHELKLENQPTQFAPFVVENGKIVPVHIIYVDNKLVYLSDMTNIQPYSFEVGENPVNIRLRTKNHQINLDSIQFKAQNKTILSLDVNQSYSNVRVKEVPNQLATSERNQLINHVMPYRLTERKFAYLENDQGFHLLQPSKFQGYYNNQFVGPIHYSNVNFVQDRLYELDFKLEPNYLYFFQPKHLKQTSFQSYKYPNFLSNNEIPEFYDLVITEEKIETMSEISLLNQKRFGKLFNYPNKTTKNKGTLYIEHEGTPNNIIISNLTNEDEFRIYSGNSSKIYDLSPGNYRLIFIYSNETYSIEDAVEIQPNGINYYKAEGLEKLSADSFSDEVSSVITNFLLNQNKDVAEAYQQKLQQVYQQNVEYLEDGNLFRGKVTDFNNVPLPGVNLIIKGTNYGTQTDFDGNFQLSVPKKYSKIQVEYLGFKTQIVDVDEFQFQQIFLESDTKELNDIIISSYSNSRKYEQLVHSESIENHEKNTSLIHQLQGQIAGVSITQASGSPGSSGVTIIRGKSSLSSSNKPLYIINGVPYDGDSISLASDLIQDIQVLKDESALAIYGNRAKNGVIIISTSQTDFQFEEDLENDSVPDFAMENSEANSIRTNFSDEAFWKPNLTTNEEGKASFSITYPDDVTSWNTHFYAVTESQKTGQTSQNVKSYRPLVSQLSIPKYLIEGDSLFGIGKVKNYLKDSIAIQTQFRINEEIQFSKEKEIFDFEADHLQIVANNLDTLQISYQVTRQDIDYLDGEELSIPVFPKGMEKAVGEFQKLQKKDTLKLNFDPNLGEAELKINAHLRQVLEEELEVVINYLHDCNEQIASRLKAQLIKRKIYQKQNRNFDDDKDIKKLIRLLQKNQKSNSLWGWWENSSTNYWASLNVVQALLMAEEQEFKVKWDELQIQQKLTDQLFLEENVSTRIQLLQLLDVMKININFREEVENLIQNESLSIVERFQLWEMYQKHAGIVPVEELMKYQKESALGNWYMEADDKHFFHPYKNSMQASLIAYRILSRMENQQEASEKIKDYLIMQRSFGGYANTYQSMQVIETLLEAVSNPENTRVNYQIQVNNKDWQTIDASSFAEVYRASDEVKLVNTSALPIYVNYVQKYFDANPKNQENMFEVETHFENEYDEVLQPNEIEIGRPISLKISLDLKKEANYFMLEVPIPSGFSYHNKKQFQNETHRAYAKDKTYIFMESLNEGKHAFEIELMPRYQGSYQLNPAKAMLMYFEHQYGNNEIKQIQVGE